MLIAVYKDASGSEAGGVREMKIVHLNEGSNLDWLKTLSFR